VQAWLKETFTQCHVTENYASTEAGAITRSYGDGENKNEIVDDITVKLVDWGHYKVQ
jgi:hypothetical protein